MVLFAISLLHSYTDGFCVPIFSVAFSTLVVSVLQFSVAFSYLQYLSQAKQLTNNRNSYKYRGIAVVLHIACIEFRE